RWGHVNRNASLLTKVQSLGIDGHFAVEQSARNWNDLYMNFNGTAGIMSVKAIEEAGGWSDDTLTEDMDLSYRMQVAGWKTHYLIDLECPAEVPEDINAFKSQQFRWAKGSIQTAKKIIPKVMKDDVPFFKKLQAVLHTTHYSIHPLMLILAVQAYPVAVLNNFQFGPLSITWIYLAILFCSTAPTALYLVSQKSLGGNWLQRFAVYPVLMCVGSGMCISNTRAFLEAVFGKVSGFVRTPKKGDIEKKHYEVKIPVVPFLEIAVGLYCAWSLKGFLSSDQWLAGPFVLIYSIGFLFNGTLSLIHNGFFKQLFGALAKPYGQLIFVNAVLFLGLSQTEPGSFQFKIFFVATAILALILWRLSPAKFEASHLFLLFAFAVVVRLFFIDFQVSDDVYRYIWEGRIQNAGFDPYILSPDSAQLEGMRDELWSGINHKDWSAIYGPAALILFKVIAFFSPAVEAFKLAFVLLDLATLGMLYLILKKKGHHPGSLVLYAFNPLVILAFAGEAHLDSLQMFLVIASYFFCISRKWTMSALLIGLAISSKFTAIVFLPFLIRKENWQWLLVSIISVFVPALFFEASVQQMFSSLFRFGAEMRFNDSIHFVFFKIFGQGTAAYISAGLLVVVSVAIWMTQDSPLRVAFFCCFAFLLLSPTVHYWYLCMLVPFLVLVPSVPAMVWTVSSVFYFNVMWRNSHGLGFSHSLMDQALQYIPVLVSLVVVIVLKVKGKSLEEESENLPDLSVLIPVLNEESNAVKIMDRLKEQTVKANEVIVIDGGSTDNSVFAFEEAGATVLKCLKKGRGNQIAEGLKKATSEAVLILHADMIPDSRVVERVVKALAADPELKGGALGASFESDSFKYKVITFLNLLRVALTGISFGDQGQFFRRKEVIENGCLKEIPLMEDVELGMRLQALGKTRLLDGGLTVSVRRWKTKNVWKNAFHIFYLLSRYLFLRRTRSELKVDGFYKEYYSDKEAETA
ncbi:MAG: glycosyltransferase, partial [Lentisphaeraceae bacterium]|nr:glycosyltransferase [Lentisphaeraceae bacterium]